MAVATTRHRFEKRAVRVALQAYLTANNWTGITMSEGYDAKKTIKERQVNILILDNQIEELQLGRTRTDDKAFTRTIQVDCYMSNEDEADAISDTIFDFMDMESIYIQDQSAAILGTMICQNTRSIVSRTVPPILSNPSILKWRSITRGDYEAHYYPTA